MNRSSRKPFAKTSISLPEQLWAFAQQRAEAEGFNSVSAYIADLIRRDRELYPPAKPQHAVLDGAQASFGKTGEAVEGTSTKLVAAALNDEAGGGSGAKPVPGGKPGGAAHYGKGRRRRAK